MACLSEEPAGFLQERASTQNVPLAITEEQAQAVVYQSHAFHVAQVPKERQGLLVVGSCPGVLALRRVLRHPLKHECPAQAELVPSRSQERRALLQVCACLAIVASAQGTDP